MHTLTTRNDADRARDILEQAHRDHTFCATCGETMGIADHGQTLWIECSSLRSRTGLRLRFEEAMHERHRIDLPVSELVLAA
jgi:Fe2+ or Zn2+ uptake regulation protein